ncbi:MAG TPA: PQQ-dependent sugar dehydrogenase, partial [Bacteroidia bacterium]|nr:PQQ-dependent sugar dehydrogenase [Bacteroidia bacterium]
MKTTCYFIISFFSFLAANLQAQTYTQTTVVTGMSYPVAFAIAPDGRFFCTQKGGNSDPAVNAQIKVYNSTGTYLGVFYDLTDSVDADFERGLLGIELDPNFTTNHWLYVYYVHLWNSDERIRIVRFTENNNVGTNPRIIFDFNVPDNLPGNHFGGNLHFNHTDTTHLYFTIGDFAINQTVPAQNYGQDTTVPFGKTNRIFKYPVNYNPASNWSANIPTDNPFYDDGDPTTGACDLIWSYGHRNPFDFCFSPITDTMYVSENGLNTWDEVNVIHRGGNYGWAYCEGDYLNSSTTSPCNNPAYINPITEWGAPLGGITGIVYYTGPVMPEFDDHLLVADNDYGRVFDITLGNSPAFDMATSNVLWMDMTTSGGLTTLREGSDGCIYAMKGGYTTNGQIYRVCPQGLGTEDFENPVFGLQQNAPNPFSESTVIKYNMKQAAQAKIVIYDIFGREVAVLADG